MCLTGRWACIVIRAMKRAAGRPQDLVDIEALKSIQRLREEEPFTDA